MIALVKSIIYGFISGLTEIIPVSSRGHQSIMMQLFGMSQRDPLLDLMVHIGILACVIFWALIAHLKSADPWINKRHIKTDFCLPLVFLWLFLCFSIILEQSMKAIPYWLHYLWPLMAWSYLFRIISAREINMQVLWDLLMECW